ncbi:MAG: GNAT family N-acetyltransferase [Phycisphaerales bacterium]|nr:GNAT family N-acetyltransferase [Phycisphaerales bacterium]
MTAPTPSPESRAASPGSPVRVAAPTGASTPAPTPGGAPSLDSPIVRRLRDADPIPEITKLLHRAYAAQVAMGLAPLAGRQDDATTARRCNSGECYVATLKDTTHPRGERIVGIILFHEEEPDQGPPWFQQPHVDSFSQFAVDTNLQGRGIGQILLDTVERRARECGSTELALSMADPDTALKNFYLKRGYRFVEFWKWPYTNYTSAILSKTL